MLICTFSSGRTGTGYLSQVFGGEYSKLALHKNNNSIVTHESWPNIKYLIKDIKKNGYSSEIIERINNDLNNQLNYINKEFDVDKYFITDHRIGRFLIKEYNGNFKVIKIFRNKENTKNSIIKRINNTKNKFDLKTYNIFIEQLWSMSFYSPFDHFIDDNNAILSWNNYSLEESIEWYLEEVEKQWALLKSDLKEDQYIEIYFEDMFNQNTINSISNFIDIKYNKEFIKIRANK